MQIKWHFFGTQEIKEPLKKGRKGRVKTDKICQNGRKSRGMHFVFAYVKAVSSTIFYDRSQDARSSGVLHPFPYGAGPFESTVASCRPYARMSGIFEKGCALSFSAI